MKTNVFHKMVDGGLTFWCPGCSERHVVYHGPGPGPRWEWNGDLVSPTISPSVLVRFKKMTDKGEADWKAWGDAGYLMPPPVFETRELVCHSYVRDGHIEFLNDCSHAMAGKTVPLEPLS